MELCQFLGVAWKVKDFNDEFRSLDKAPKMWGGTVKWDLGYCWWAAFLAVYPIISHYWEGFIHPRWCRISSINSSVEDVDGRIFISWDSPCRLQSRKNMMEYEEIHCVALWTVAESCCQRVFFSLVEVNAKGKCRCQWNFLSPPKKSPTALQFARKSAFQAVSGNPWTLNLMSGWKWSLGACRVWTLNGQAANIPFQWVILLWVLMLPFLPRLFPVIVRLSQSKPFAVTHEQLLDLDMVVGTGLTD